MQVGFFQFDYRGFVNETLPVKELADAGKYDEVVRIASRRAKKIKAKDWPLEGFGTTLKGISKLKADSAPSKTGFSLLVFLGFYLTSLSFFSPLTIVSIGTDLVGWNRRDVRLLSDGLVLMSVYGETIDGDPLKRPPAPDKRWHDPEYYLWWFRPSFAFSCGWWGLQEIEYLHNKLREVYPELEQLDETLLEKRLRLLPQETSARDKLLLNYQSTLEVFEKSLSIGQGLFKVKSA